MVGLTVLECKVRPGFKLPSSLKGGILSSGLTNNDFVDVRCMDSGKSTVRKGFPLIWRSIGGMTQLAKSVCSVAVSVSTQGVVVNVTDSWVEFSFVVVTGGIWAGAVFLLEPL